MYVVAIETNQHDLIQSSIILTKDKIEEVKEYLLRSNNILNVYVLPVDVDTITMIDELFK